MVEKVKFTAPVVVEDTTIEVSMASMDDLNKKGNVEAPSEDVEVEVKDEGPKVIETPVQAEIFTVVEEQPGYPGGEEARISYLQQNIKYPEEAKELGIQGKVFVTFVVEVDGSISDVRVLRGIGGGCDEEAIRVVRSMPKWVPGKQRGVPVRVQFNLPIKFTLQ
jgi:protein TonB